jgi:hypothetical protein
MGAARRCQTLSDAVTRSQTISVTSGDTGQQPMRRPVRSVRDEEAAGSNPATPTEKFQLDAMITKLGDHGIDHLLAIRWRDRTPVRGMRRGGSAGNATPAGHRPSRVEGVPCPRWQIWR